MDLTPVWTTLAYREWHATSNGASLYIRQAGSKGRAFRWSVVRDGSTIHHGTSERLDLAQARAALASYDVNPIATAVPGWFKNSDGIQQRVYSHRDPRIRAVVQKRGPAWRFDVFRSNERIASGYKSRPHDARQACDRLGNALVAESRGEPWSLTAA